MNKTAIKNFAVWARRKLISDITYKAGMLGITESGIAQPMKQSTKDLQFFDIGTKDYVEISGDEIRQRNALLSAIHEKEKTSDYKTAFQSVVEEVAYTWFNRLIAVRFMEVNDYLPSHIRVLSSENPSKLEPDFVTSPFDTDIEFSPYEKDVILQLKEDNKLDELFRMLFIKQCNKFSEILPELFEQISDYTELLLTISFTDKDGVIYHLTHDISEDDFDVNKEGQVEIIGWLYQYYNTEPKDEVFALLKKNVKITKERIPAATQLFTPDWIVRYMVENSLGRLWVEGHPNDELKANWKYYLEEAEQEPDVQAQLEKIREEYAEINPEDIKVIDPCMGSGHILVYAFDVLMQIYVAQGYTQRDAAKSILENNLYGIDIDTRAYQLAYFAVMMKARQYNRRIFGEGIRPNLMAVKNPEKLSSSVLKRLGDLDGLGKRLIKDFSDVEEYGSIINVSYTKEELDALDAKLDDIDKMADYGDILTQMESIECVQLIAPLVRQARIMGQKYDVVITNPPYMGASGMSAKLSEYVKKNFPDSKSDMFAVFIEKCGMMLKKNGYQAMITQQGWMFLSSYEKLRIKLQHRDTINLIHLGARAFEEIAGEVVQTASFVMTQRSISDYNGVYCKLTDASSQTEKEELFLSGKNRYRRSKKQFELVPGTLNGYYLSNEVFEIFSTGESLAKVGAARQGLGTSDNVRFLRLWTEVDFQKIGFGLHSTEETIDSDYKWYPYVKGGSFRRWHPVRDYVVNYQADGREIKASVMGKYTYLKSPDFVVKNTSTYFSEGITWSDVATGKFSARWVDSGYIYADAGPMFFAGRNPLLKLAYMNSPVFQLFAELICQGLHYSTGQIPGIPYLEKFSSELRDKTELIAKENIDIVKTSGNLSELSWEFSENPIITLSKVLCDATAVGASIHYYYGGHLEVSCPLELCYMLWKGECNERFKKLKANEEELNRIFIDMYGLQEELTPEVIDEDVTVRKADLLQDIKAFISYAVGCMFGRYSLDTPGIAYAGGEWDDSKYRTYIPDADNCIPVTDEEYFEDDIVGRFVEFVRVVYDEESLESNLVFIAKALGDKGKTPRDTIRQYFLNDFFKDHCQTYSVTGSGKRPIYWLFDSGKQSGFKALVYMHRWNADTVGNMRVEYLHKMQKVYEHEMDACQDIIDNSMNNHEIAVATRRKEKLVKQAKECRDYDAKIAHIALSRIQIDLDNGVKINYRKVQTGADGKFCEILADSAKIMADDKLWESSKSWRK